MADDMAFIRAQIQGIKAVLAKTPQSSKAERAGIDLSKEVNSIVERLGRIAPSLKPGLPRPIGATTPFRKIGKSDATYLEIEIICEQLLTLMELNGQ